MCCIIIFFQIFLSVQIDRSNIPSNLSHFIHSKFCLKIFFIYSESKINFAKFNILSEISSFLRQTRGETFTEVVTLMLEFESWKLLRKGLRLSFACGRYIII